MEQQISLNSPFQMESLKDIAVGWELCFYVGDVTHNIQGNSGVFSGSRLISFQPVLNGDKLNKEETLKTAKAIFLPLPKMIKEAFENGSMREGFCYKVVFNGKKQSKNNKAWQYNDFSVFVNPQFDELKNELSDIFKDKANIKEVKVDIDNQPTAPKRI